MLGTFSSAHCSIHVCALTCHIYVVSHILENDLLICEKIADRQSQIGEHNLGLYTMMEYNIQVYFFAIL